MIHYVLESVPAGQPHPVPALAVVLPMWLERAADVVGDFAAKQVGGATLL